MGKYIGFKLIHAEPMTVAEYNERVRPLVYSGDSQEGYMVTYPDRFISWSPKEVFEKAYMQVGDNNTITQELVDSFIVCYETVTQQNKITIVTATLANNFTLVESSACVDPANYSEELGAQICKARIKEKVWFLLGFLLQTAKDGVS